MTDKYAVIGNPVEHSRSPDIHAMFAAQTAAAVHYGRLLAPLDGFAAQVDAFFRAGGRGLNVTVPFKQEAFALAAQCSDQARLAGAVNTLLLNEEGQLCGHNTDGIGLLRDISANLQQSLAGCSVLVLGAGGATRGILQPLLEQGPARVVVANRTVVKATELAQLFAPLGPISGCGYSDLPAAPFDWIINATAASLQGELPPLPPACCGPATRCYDLMYGAEPTAFMQWAAAQGAALTADGLGMLVEQAAESWYLWRGVRPETTSVMQRLREQLAGQVP
ncbi:MAG TPA: shikimate dehydrogenase [Pseudomonadaceae bacterium]|nr:shikimate dehydrogenase [Pseudomonadaceae bacterium]